jgi:hypothetical protein
MIEGYKAFLAREGDLNRNFRAHVGRDWGAWREEHYYASATAIPDTAERVWLERQKLNYRGIHERRSVRHLVASKVDQPFLEEIGSLGGLERLELEWPMVARSLSPILQLENLRFLSIDSPRHIDDFSPLLELPCLRTFILTNAKKMPDLQWLSDAHHLEVIGIEGGMWSPYRIPSLMPLAGLRQLQAFLGTSTKLADKQLLPLADCDRLQYLGIACVAPREEFERLQRARPDLVCSWFRAETWNAIAPRRTRP